jgi:hypothetical protein
MAKVLEDWEAKGKTNVGDHLCSDECRNAERSHYARRKDSTLLIYALFCVVCSLPVKKATRKRNHDRNSEQRHYQR